MCYSAMVEQDYRLYKRTLHSDIDFEAFLDLFVLRLEDDSIRIPKAMEANFDSPQSPIEERIKDAIDQYRAKARAKLEAALFAQKKRLADAERTLATKTIKKALEDRRIATDESEPPPEIAQAGHDRRIIPLQPSAVDAWLNPIVEDRASLNGLLDRRERPCYEHQLAA